MKSKAEKNKYNKLWMRAFRAKKREAKMLKKNQCPVCGIFMTPENLRYHLTCPYFIAHGHPRTQ
jgi:hypothetical protein